MSLVGWDWLVAEINKKADESALTAHTGHTNNPHAVTKEQVGLGSVPDEDWKTANMTVNADTATNMTAETSERTSSIDGHFNWLRQKINGVIAGKANLASPALTGTPTAPTAPVGANSQQLATTAFVMQNRAGIPVFPGRTFSNADILAYPNIQDFFNAEINNKTFSNSVTINITGQHSRPPGYDTEIYGLTIQNVNFVMPWMNLTLNCGNTGRIVVSGIMFYNIKIGGVIINRQSGSAQPVNNFISAQSVDRFQISHASGCLTYTALEMSIQRSTATITGVQAQAGVQRFSYVNAHDNSFMTASNVYLGDELTINTNSCVQLNTGAWVQIPRLDASSRLAVNGGGFTALPYANDRGGIVTDSWGATGKNNVVRRQG